MKTEKMEKEYVITGMVIGIVGGAIIGVINNDIGNNILFGSGIGMSLGILFNAFKENKN